MTANRWIAKKSANIRTLDDLKGKTIVSTTGSTNIKQLTEINAQRNLGMRIISANGLPEAFHMVETGRAVAFVMDDILLYSLAAQSRSPKEYAISAEALSVEPYGIILRKDETAFKKVVDGAMTRIYKSDEIVPICRGRMARIRSSPPRCDRPTAPSVFPTVRFHSPATGAPVVVASAMFIFMPGRRDAGVENV